MMQLLKFGAPWCSPCKAMDPLLDEVTQLTVERIDIEEHPDEALKYGVRSVPTLIILDEDGNPLAVRSGGMTRQQLQQFIRSAQ